MTDDSFQKRIEISVTIYIIFILYIIVKQNPPKNQNCHPSSVICTGIKFMPESLELSFLFTTFAHKDTYNMKEDKPYSRFEEKDDSCPIAAETAAPDSGDWYLTYLITQALFDKFLIGKFGSTKKCCIFAANYSVWQC